MVSWLSNPGVWTLAADQDAIVFVPREILDGPLFGQADRPGEVDRPALAHIDSHMGAEGIGALAEKKKVQRLEFSDCVRVSGVGPEFA